MGSVIEITEKNTTKYLYFGYGSSVLFTLFSCIIFSLYKFISICIKNKQMNAKKNKNKNKNKTSNKHENKNEMESMPTLKKKKSVYFYHDTENDGDELSQKSNNIENNDDDKPDLEIDPFPSSDIVRNAKTNDDKQENIALSVKSTRSNSIDHNELSLLQSPSAQ